MDVIAKLHADHVNVALIADMARNELRRLERGETADYSLLEDVMCYVTGYPDTHHHPTEDVVFEKLKERTPEMAAEVDAILAEHADLIATGKRFLQAIRAVTGEAFVLRDDLIARGYAYLSMLERHMDTEEGRLFPAARTALTAPDWVELDKRIEHRRDPLFGCLDEDYRRLWRRIQARRTRDVDERFR